jgi:hypothetical protein
MGTNKIRIRWDGREQTPKEQLGGPVCLFGSNTSSMNLLQEVVVSNAHFSTGDKKPSSFKARVSTGSLDLQDLIAWTLLRRLIVLEVWGPKLIYLRLKKAGDKEASLF